MVEEGFSWIYLIFFLIPLARIIPRLLKKWRKGKDPFNENQISSSNLGIEKRPEPFERAESFEKPQNKETQVLGELNKGIKDFNKIQKNLSISNQELEHILKDLEDQGLMKVVKKSGFTGNKVELYPTDKGFKRYYT
ncbi:MAG: hypothetical protein HRO68_04255 [Nitrosopumilus sp.]|nr:hypothetical protein [Nitrosopumilus sp.]